MKLFGDDNRRLYSLKLHLTRKEMDYLRRLLEAWLSDEPSDDINEHMHFDANDHTAEIVLVEER